jgi:DNA-binding transcriptional MerR regulator/methylmalonyl-CoA mutase cobalamin-binding subunit
MSKDTSNDVKNPEALFPIRTVSSLTNVNSITLRAWESRYGLINPLRKSSGHRLYTQADIDIINRTVALLDRGMRISQVKSELTRQGSPVTSQEASAQDIWQKHINHMQSAVICFDEAALDESYTEMLATHPVKVVTERLLNPLLRQLGDRWNDMTGSIAEEHFFGFYLRSKLGARLHHRVRHRQGPTLLLACLPGDQHEIGLLLLALAANERQFRTIILGANMPMEDLTQVAEKADCSAIILSSTVQPAPDVFKNQLPALVASAKVPVFIGGPCSIAASSIIERAGAIVCGADIEVGLSKIDNVLGR